MANWAELPNDVLEHLTRFMPLKEYHCFSVVCKNWYLVAKEKRHPPAEHLPWLVLGEDDTKQKRVFFSITENKHYYIDIPELRGQYICGSSYGWLFTMDIELNFRLLNPFTRKCYDLPPLPPYDYGCDITTYRKVPDSETCFPTFADVQIRLVYKAILDHDPCHNSEFTVLILYGSHRKLAFWRLNEPAWIQIGRGCPVFDDIIFFKKNFYAAGTLTNSVKIYLVHNGSNPKATQVGPLVPLLPESFCYLVDFMGELMLMQRWLEEVEEDYFVTKRIMVHQVDLKEKRYRECKLINDQAFFMGANLPVVVDPNKFPECKKNALYLTDVPTGYSGEYGCKDLWIYDIYKASFSTYYDRRTYIPLIASPIWLTPNW